MLKYLSYRWYTIAFWCSWAKRASNAILRVCLRESGVLNMEISKRPSPRPGTVTRPGTVIRSSKAITCWCKRSWGLSHLSRARPSRRSIASTRCSVAIVLRVLMMKTVLIKRGYAYRRVLWRFCIKPKPKPASLGTAFFFPWRILRVRILVGREILSVSVAWRSWKRFATCKKTHEISWQNTTFLINTSTTINSSVL